MRGKYPPPSKRRVLGLLSGLFYSIYVSPVFRPSLVVSTLRSNDPVNLGCLRFLLTRSNSSRCMSSPAMHDLGPSPCNTIFYIRDSKFIFLKFRPPNNPC